MKRYLLSLLATFPLLAIAIIYAVRGGETSHSDWFPHDQSQQILAYIEDYRIVYHVISELGSNECPKRLTVTACVPPAITVTNGMWTITFDFEVP